MKPKNMSILVNFDITHPQVREIVGFQATPDLNSRATQPQAQPEGAATEETRDVELATCVEVSTHVKVAS